MVKEVDFNQQKAFIGKKGYLLKVELSRDSSGTDRSSENFFD